MKGYEVKDFLITILVGLAGVIFSIACSLGVLYLGFLMAKAMFF